MFWKHGLLRSFSRVHWDACTVGADMCVYCEIEISHASCALARSRLGWSNSPDSTLYHSSHSAISSPPFFPSGVHLNMADEHAKIAHFIGRDARRIGRVV